MPSPPATFRNTIAWIGAKFIAGLVFVFGRKVKASEVPWLAGPIGSDVIGDRPYQECAEREQLVLTRNAEAGGLLPDFGVLAGPSFDASAVSPRVREFYEQTAKYRMDVWSKSAFPASVALWLLVTTISRKVDQLNFPVDVLESARGMTSEIVLLDDARGVRRYTGWLRRMAHSGRVIYTGFYMTQTVPEHPSPCVKVVFPMPDGNATVILRPELDTEGNFHLVTTGKTFGDVGFYRVAKLDAEHLRVWRIRTLREHFRLFVDDEGVLRCDHSVRFLGFPVLQLHYRIETKS